MVAVGLGVVVRAPRPGAAPVAGGAAACRAGQRGRRGRALAAPADRPADATTRGTSASSPTTSARRRRRRSASATASSWPCATSTRGPHWFDQTAGKGPFLDAGSAGVGAVTLAVWLVAAVVAWRIGSAALRALHAVVGVALAARRGLDGPHLRAPVVLPHAVGLGRRRGARRRRGVDGAGLVAALAGRSPVAIRCRARGASRPVRSPSSSSPDLRRRLRRRRPPRGAPQRGRRHPGRADLRRRRRWRRCGDRRGRSCTSCAGATPPTSAVPASGCSTSSSGAASTSRPTSSSTSRSPTTAPARAPRPTPRSTWPPAATSTSGAHVPDAVEVATFDPLTPSAAGRVRASSAQWFAERLADGGSRRAGAADRHQPVRHLHRHPAVAPPTRPTWPASIELGQPMAVFIAPPPADADPDSAVTTPTVARQAVRRRARWRRGRSSPACTTAVVVFATMQGPGQRVPAGRRQRPDRAPRPRRLHRPLAAARDLVVGVGRRRARTSTTPVRCCSTCSPCPCVHWAAAPASPSGRRR